MVSIAEYFYYGLIALFVLILVGYLGMSFYNDFENTARNEEWIVDGTQLAKTPKVVSGDKIPASENGRYGVEFTYMTWLFINDLTYDPHSSTSPQVRYWPVMVKGSANRNPNQTPYLAAPGILLGPNNNSLTVVMNTLKDDSEREPTESITVDNLPMNKWFQLAVVLMNNKLDIYINENLRERLVLKGIPQINKGDLFVGSSAGFDGFISNAKYLAYAAPYYKIDQHFRNGPSDKPCQESGAKPPYLAPNYWVESQ